MMARYSRKHYEDVAKILLRTRNQGYQSPTINFIRARFRDLFAADNSRFDTEQFIRNTEWQPQKEVTS